MAYHHITTFPPKLILFTQHNKIWSFKFPNMKKGYNSVVINQGFHITTMKLYQVNSLQELGVFGFTKLYNLQSWQERFLLSSNFCFRFCFLERLCDCKIEALNDERALYNSNPQYLECHSCFKYVFLSNCAIEQWQGFIQFKTLESLQEKGVF